MARSRAIFAWALCVSGIGANPGARFRFALHSDASTEAATAVAAEYFPVTVKITTDWLARWSWHYKNSDAVNETPCFLRFDFDKRLLVAVNRALASFWCDGLSQD